MLFTNRSRLTVCLLFAVFTLSAGGLRGADPEVEKYRAAAVKRWESQIAKLEQQDKQESHPEDSILFVGSSSIRIWKDIVSDMAPYHPIQRGYGGAQWSDVAVFADRLIHPHRFRAAVFFVGNDIRGAETDKSPEQVAHLFEHVLKRLRAHNPKAPVFYIAVTPTESRLHVWSKTKQANTAVRAVCDRHENAYFIGTESVFLDANGKPRPQYFRDDKLHLRREGYVRWAAVIKSHLDTVLDGAGVKP